MRNLLTTYSKTLKACALVLLLLFSITPGTNASHIVGGEIYYQWVSGNTYNVKLSFYRDCSGIPAAASQIITYSSTSCGLSGSFIANPVGAPEQVSPICASSLSNSSCNGGVLYGVEKVTYEGVVTLPGNCVDWEFSYNECCRNAGITNLQNGSGYGSYFSAMLNNLNVPFNNSVSFGNIPYSIINNNATTQLSWNTFDEDGDSLIYELVPARDYIGSAPFNLTYVPGCTYLEPFFSSLPTSLDYGTGILEVTPNQVQISVVCMKISEYRNGFHVGEVYRDYQIVVENNTNTPPSLSGINGTTSFITNGCPGDSITFTVQGSDADLGQNVSLSMNNPGTTATFISTAGTNPVGTFTWIPTGGDVNASAYTFIISAIDDNCPYYGTNSQAYYVYVNGCNTYDVWPGDANADGSADLYDLLPIGVAYNDYGPVRPAPSLNWIGQSCNDWAYSFMSGVNHKHADTDGNGTVNFDDTTAIFQNYGMNHPLRLSNPNITTIADISVTASSDTIGLSSVVNFDVAIDTPVDSIYGLAFRLFFDPNMIDVNSISVSYPGSIFGINGVDMIKLDRSQGMNGFADIALTRVNHSNISGSGPVARVTIVTTDNVSGKVSLIVSPLDVTGITADESFVPLNGIADEVVIDPNFVGINEPDLNILTQVYPTPAHDYINFSYSGTQKVDYIKLFDLAGKEVLQVLNPTSFSTIDVKTLSNGTYTLKAGIGQHSIYKKIMIF